MLSEYGPVTQALLGTLFTWGMTALGASMIVIIRGSQRKLLDISLGFSAGVMTAASFWSLLAPAIEYAKNSGIYGENGEWAIVPVGVGFLLGCLFVYGTDVLIDYTGVDTTNIMLAMTKTNSKCKDDDNCTADKYSNDQRVSHYQLNAITVDVQEENMKQFSDCITNQHYNSLGSSRRRFGYSNNVENNSIQAYQDFDDTQKELEMRRSRWKRIILLAIAITVHNIPEGLAVGVGFGAAATSNSTSFENARNLAIGIGIQNFPEGLAVSLPLHTTGFSMWRSFWYGQLSGMVEPVFGILGAVAVKAAQPVLPYALAFAAGAMIYVVNDDIIPEANTSGNGKLATWGSVVGFLVMMFLDVAFG